MPKRLRSLLPVIGLGLLLAGGCEVGSTGSFAIEIAPLSAICSSETTCTRRTRDIPLDACTQLQLCLRTDAFTCEPLALLRPEQSHEGMGDPIYALRFDRSRFELDLTESMAERDVSVRLYAPAPGQDPMTDTSRRPLAEGTVRSVRFGDNDPIRVRLYEYGRWSCAGSYGGDSLTASPPPPRALHQAVSLPNGDVLLLGGISRGADMPTFFHTSIPADRGAALEPSVQVYDSSRGRFLDVTVQGGSFRRVGFAATLLSSGSGDVHRIRISGGITADEGEAVRINGTLTPTDFGELFRPGAESRIAEDAILVYNARRHSLTLDPSPAASAYAFVSQSGSFGDRVALFYGMSAFTNPNMTSLVGRLETINRQGQTPTLEAFTTATLPGNIGGTVSWLPSGNLLLWGGNVGSADATVMATESMLIVSPTNAASQRASLPATWPASSAYHTATEVDGDVIVVGGLDVAQPGSSIRVQRLPHAVPMAALRETGGSLSVIDIARADGMPLPEATVLHTATPRVRATGTTELLVIGGATAMAIAGTEQTFFEQATAGRITPDGSGGYNYVPLPDLSNGRFGHTATMLPGDRVLVVGGMRRSPADANRLEVVDVAEIYQLTARPEAITSCTDGPVPTMMADPLDSGDGCSP